MADPYRIYGQWQTAGFSILTDGKGQIQNDGSEAFAQAVVLVDDVGVPIGTDGNPLVVSGGGGGGAQDVNIIEVGGNPVTTSIPVSSDQLPATLGVGLPAESLSVTDAKLSTYSAAISTAPTASGLVVLMQGSATRTIRVTRVGFSGTHTAAERGNVALVRYSTAASGGTTGATPTPVALDSGNPAPTAVLTYYTAPPTQGTLVGTVRLAKVLVSTVTTGGENVNWTFGANEDQGLTLRGTSQWLSVNLSSFGSYAGASDFIEIEWTEE